MRTGRFLVFGSVALSLAGALTFAACGGSSESTPPPAKDSGIDSPPDTYVAPPVDAGIDAPSPVDANDAGCIPVDADLNSIGVPDAAIGDTGATSNGCIACAHAECQTYIDQCNADCECKDLLVGALSCFDADGGLNCALGLAGTTDTTATNFGECVYAGCSAQCGFPSFGKDGGATDGAATDAADTDGAADGGTD